MTAEDLVINDCSDGETVETVGERLPQLNTVPSLACKRREAGREGGEGGGGRRERKGERKGGQEPITLLPRHHKH